MECIMQGIIETQHVEGLAVLLQGLCGSQRQAVKIHDLCLKSGPNLGQVPSEMHLMCDLSHQEPRWIVRHVGGAMRGAGAEQMPALVRSVLNCRISNNALRFFHSLGYKLDHELLQTGFKFQFHKVVPITVSVTSVCKIPKLHMIEEAVPITPGLQLVEVSASTSGDNYTEVAAAVSGLAEQLAP
ncbi:hypothetical protein KP509_31G037700 [Ceratopteris richardii]|nr:hypothetical protein KP509_31G037700 [Ceratopteris richardii]KAH7288707.1 hypothetical protein KP509_31G037700 [Ceratopteris richardii]